MHIVHDSSVQRHGVSGLCYWLPAGTDGRRGVDATLVPDSSKPAVVSLWAAEGAKKGTHV